VRLRPWFDALFKATIMVYPQPEFGGQVDLVLARGEAETASVRGRCQDRNTAMRELRTRGWTLRQIAERFGVSVARVGQICAGMSHD
jgi:hypothetical protein